MCVLVVCSVLVLVDAKRNRSRVRWALATWTFILFRIHYFLDTIPSSCQGETSTSQKTSQCGHVSSSLLTLSSSPSPSTISSSSFTNHAAKKKPHLSTHSHLASQHPYRQERAFISTLHCVSRTSRLDFSRMSIAAYLQTELVALSNEARRKYPEIKEVNQQPPELKARSDGPGSKYIYIYTQCNIEQRMCILVLK